MPPSTRCRKYPRQRYEYVTAPNPFSDAISVTPSTPSREVAALIEGQRQELEARVRRRRRRRDEGQIKQEQRLANHRQRHDSERYRDPLMGCAVTEMADRPARTDADVDVSSMTSSA